MKKSLTITAAAAMLLISGCSAPGAAPEATPSPEPVDISCCVSPEISGVMNDIYKKYIEDCPGLIITFNADTPKALEDEIRGGNGYDIIFSVSKESIDALEAGGFIVPGTVTPMLSDSAVFIRSAKKDSKIKDAEDIVKAKTAAVAPQGTPLSNYSSLLMDKTDTKIKTVEYDTTEDIVDAVADGETDIGIIYSTDAAAARSKVKAITHPVKDMGAQTSEYTVALVNDPSASQKEAAAAEAFFKYLTSEPARSSFIYYGFSMICERN